MASQSGSGLADFIERKVQREAKLLQQPKFQVQLVGELTKKGNPPGTAGGEASGGGCGG